MLKINGRLFYMFLFKKFVIFKKKDNLHDKITDKASPLFIAGFISP